jgi:hypothetical protein
MHPIHCQSGRTRWVKALLNSAISMTRGDLLNRRPTSRWQRNRMIEDLETRRMLSVGPLTGTTQTFSTAVGADCADPVRNVAYVADNGGHHIIAINTSTGSTVGFCTQAANVTGLAVSVDDTRLFAAEPSAFQIEVFSLPTMTLLKTLDIGVADSQVAAAANDRVLAAGSSLDDIDAETGTILYSVPNNGLIRSNTAGTTVYSRTLGESGDDGSLLTYDVSGTGAPVQLANTPGPTGANSEDFAVDPVLEKAFYMDGGAYGVQVENLTTDTGTLWPFVQGIYGVGVAELPGGQYVYGMSSSDIEQFNQNGVALNTFTLPSGENNASLVITPNGNLVYTFGSGVGIIGISTLTIDTTPELGFAVEPSNGLTTAPISPAIQVNIQSPSGNPLTGNTSNVTISIATGDGTITGTTTVAAVAGVATFSNLEFTAGTYTLTATDGIIPSATSTSFTVVAPILTVLPPSSQTVLIDTSSTITLGTFSETNATSPFTVDVNWGDGTTDTTFSATAAGTLASQTHTYNTAGAQLVTVTVTDASGLVTGQNSFNVTVDTGNTPSTTTLQTSSGSIDLGQSVTLTATVSPSTITGTVNFLQDGVSLGTATVAGGVATLITTALDSGVDLVDATYSGSPTYETSLSGYVDVTVIPPPTVTTLSLQTSSGSIDANQSITLTATLFPALNSDGTNATGNVTFYDGQDSLGTVGISSAGVAVLTTTAGLPVGANVLSAVYAGDVNFTSSTSTDITTSVVPSASQTGLSLSNHSRTMSQQVTFTANIGPNSVTPTTLSTVVPTGTVTFFDNGTALGTSALSANGVATLTTAAALPLGIDIITSTYSGDSAFSSSTSAVSDLYVTTQSLVPVVTSVAVPPSAVGGARIHGTVSANITNKLDNIETGPETGTYSVEIFASATTTLNTVIDPLVATALRTTPLREGKSLAVKVPVTSYPTTLPTGTYHLLLQTVDEAGNTEEVDTGKSVEIIAPVVSLSASFVSVPVNVFKSGAYVSITTSGNTIDLSGFTAVIGFSTDAGGHDVVNTAVGIVKPTIVIIQPGRATKVKVTGWNALMATLPSGSFYLMVTLTDANGNSASVVSPTTMSYLT